MKKFLIIILIGAAGYFAYEYLLKEKPVLDIKAKKVISRSYSMDIEAPNLNMPVYGSIQGTVKNISDRVITNIVLKYKMGIQPVEAAIDHLEPGEQRDFTTPGIVIRNTGDSFYLEEMSYN